MTRARSGYALVEVIVAAILSTVVLASAAMLLQSQNRLAANIGTRSERNDAVRSALLTLRAELQTVAPTVDLRAVARDSVSSRIFRGIAIVCGFRPGISYVRYEGLRMPDPVKDSAMQVGVENAVTVEGVADEPAACERGAGERVLAISWRATPPVGSMWLIFESGSYHLSTNALRYRRGAESRQPITNEVIRDRASGFNAIADTIIRGIRTSLTDRATAATVEEHLLLMNHR